VCRISIRPEFLIFGIGQPPGHITQFVGHRGVRNPKALKNSPVYVAETLFAESGRQLRASSFMGTPSGSMRLRGKRHSQEAA